MENTKDVLSRAGTRLHEALFRLSKGRFVPVWRGMPFVMLTTTGRKSGKPRTIMLTAPIHDDDRTVLVASYGGDARHPAWFLNVRANPDVQVTMQGYQGPMQARVASSTEKQALWPQVVTTYPPYANYQRRTERDIPLVILERPA
jgi:deazaflavin-dependent oxidoreductase (nitroreductase family)